MEISSIGGIAQSLPMEGMRSSQGSPPGDPADRAEELASNIAEANDTDGDGLLSAEEIGGDFGSELVESLDGDEDGLLSQEELLAGIQSNMEEVQSGLGSGTTPSEDNRTFMEQIRSLAGEELPSSASQSQARASEAYSRMQGFLQSESQTTAAYDTNQWYLEGLDIAV